MTMGVTQVDTLFSFEKKDYIGDKNFIHKYEMQQAFLDFIEEPLDSLRRTREGIYESYTIDLGTFFFFFCC